MSDAGNYVLDRNFDAPVELVWRTWTEPDLVSQWFGPGVETIIHKFDLQVGGLWLNEMKMGGNSMYQRAEFTEITPTSRLVMLQSSADADWNIAASPMMPDWPKTLLTEVDFSDADGKTQMKLTWTPHEATDAELAAFGAAVAGIGQGWEAGMQIIDQILAELQS